MEPLWKVDQPALPTTPFEPGERHDVIVVGAGLTGLSTAFMLARAGMDVAVVEAGGIAQLTTGANTGKVSLLQGQQLARLRRDHPASLVRAYVDANRAGMQWLTDFADTVGVPYSRRTDHTYAQSPGGLDAVRDQHAAAREAGLATRLLGPDALPPVPFPLVGAVALDDQVAIDPVQIAQAQARELVAAGGTLHVGIRVTRVHALPTPHVDTTSGPLFARHIVLATGTPIIDRGLYFAKVRGLRSYCVSFRIPGPAPEGMFISADGPTRSIRPVAAADGPDSAQLIVGGNGHPVGRSDAETAQIDDLVDWTREHFPGAEETLRWSALDYESHNLVPFVGAMPRGLGRIRFATGYGKWGLSNGPAAALRLAAEILGAPHRERPRWMTTLGTRMTVPADLARAGAEGAKVAGELARGWARAETRSTPLPRPAEGSGSVGNRAGCPVAISTVDGVTRAVDAVCPHLGGILDWNDAERTWDCPLHASRFAPDGTRIEGPALRDLRRLPRSTQR